jgi:hypothetical protein
MTPDPALRSALEQQVAILAPMSSRLHAAHIHPPIAPRDWGGPTSRAFAERERELRVLIATADEAVGALLHDSRLALAAVGRG